MERKEPTLTSGISAQESADTRAPGRRGHTPESEPAAAPRRDLNVETTPPRRHPQAGQDFAGTGNVAAPAPSNAMATAALAIAVIGVIAAAALGWQLSQANQALAKADTRIAGLEEQLNMTSEESTASVVTLQANLKKFEAKQQQLASTLDTHSKTLADTSNKLSAAERNITQLTKDRDGLTAGVSEVKKLAGAQAAAVTAAGAKADTLATAITQQQQQQQNLNDELAKIRMEMVDVEALNVRLKTSEEAIKAIDEYRRSTNREILQLKQQITGGQ